VRDHREALTWSDAESSLSAQQQLVPALKAQCDLAQKAQDAATALAQAAERSCEAARLLFDYARDRGFHKLRGDVFVSNDRMVEGIDLAAQYAQTSVAASAQAPIRGHRKGIVE